MPRPVAVEAPERELADSELPASGVPWACASALAKLVGLDAPAAAVPFSVAPIAPALAEAEEPMGEASCCCACAMTSIRESTASILILSTHRRLGAELESAPARYEQRTSCARATSTCCGRCAGAPTAIGTRSRTDRIRRTWLAGRSRRRGAVAAKLGDDRGDHCSQVRMWWRFGSRPGRRLSGADP